MPPTPTEPPAPALTPTPVGVSSEEPPPPLPQPRVAPPGFRRRAAHPPADPGSPAAEARPAASGPPSSPGTGTAGGPPPGSAAGGSEPPPAARPSRTGSSPGSFATRAALQAGVRDGVLAATSAAHELLCRDEVDRAVGLWLADEQDTDGVSRPVAGLLSRRSDALGGGNPDLADGVGLLLALAAYAAKQLGRAREARAVRRRGLAPPPVEPVDAEGTAA